jgi:diacylglycerol kinase family enzyme
LGSKRRGDVRVWFARLVRLFPSVHSGSHLKFPEVEYFQQKRFQLTTQPEVDVDADGKYVCPTPVEIAVASGVIWVIVPA